MELSALLQELASATGLDGVFLDSDNRCTLRFDDKHDVTLEYDPEDDALLLHGVAGSSRNMRTQEAWQALLEASLLGARTGGGALSLQKATEEIVLWKRHEARFPDYPGFEKALNAFLAQLAYWKEHLPGLAESAPEAASENFALDVQAFGMRV